MRSCEINKGEVLKESDLISKILAGLDVNLVLPKRSSLDGKAENFTESEQN
jgi:hypothetical protein